MEFQALPGQRGAVLLLLEVLAVTLILFAGIALNSTMFATSKLQRQQTAQYVALEAIHSYTRGTGDYAARLDQALNKAQEIAQQNFYLAKTFSENPSATEELAMQASGPSGTLAPGYWHFSRGNIDCSLPSVKHPCPCDEMGRFAGPCFEELNLDGADAGREPNSFKATLKTRDDSPLRTVLAHLGVEESLQLRSEAIAAIIPRHGIFAVDLAHGMNTDTHMPYETVSGSTTSFASEFAFKLIQSPDPNVCPADHSNPCLTSGACVIDGGSYPGLYNFVWNSMMEQTRPEPMTDKRKHYRDDYRCFTVRYTEDNNPATKTAYYLVDTYRSGAMSVNYDGPLPLTDVLDGVNHALTLLESQAVPGDLVGAIGFDRTAGIHERIFSLSTPFNLPDGADTPFTRLKEITDITGQTDDSVTKRIERNYFIPRLSGGTNLPAAIQRAFDMLQNAPDPQLAENFVVLLSDGMTNCTQNGVCGSANSSFYENSAAEANVLLDHLYRPNHIKFHFIMSGKPARPHTLLFTSDIHPNTCMKEDDARNQDPARLFVDPTIDESDAALFRNALLGKNLTYFYKPNEFYQAVQTTGGVWGPVRPGCNGTNDVTTVLDNACKAITGGNPTTPQLVTPGNSGLSYVDANGRLGCDAQGRTNRAQIEEYIEEVLERTPYVLVD